MAKGKAAKAAKKTNFAVLSTLVSEGFELFEAKSKLWDMSNVVATGVTPDKVRQSQIEGSDQCSIVLMDEEGRAQYISVAYDEIDLDDYEVDEDGYLTDIDIEFDIIKAVALRDDEEFDITEGDETFRAVPA